MASRCSERRDLVGNGEASRASVRRGKARPGFCAAWNSFRPAEKHIRERIVAYDENGQRQEYDQLRLAGPEGARILRTVAQRDQLHARTTFERSHFQLKLAEAIEVESRRLGRDVSVAEVLGLAEAA